MIYRMENRSLSHLFPFSVFSNYFYTVLFFYFIFYNYLFLIRVSEIWLGSVWNHMVNYKGCSECSTLSTCKGRGRVKVNHHKLWGKNCRRPYHRGIYSFFFFLILYFIMQMPGEQTKGRCTITP